jgi:hypothetical protein
VTVCTQPGHGSAAAENFIIGVGGDYQDAAQMQSCDSF